MSKKLLATGAVALFLLTVIPSTYAFGPSTRFARSGQVASENFQPKSENREAVQAAIEAEDYEAFVEATGREITAEQFEEILERHEEMEAQRAEREAEREAIQAAIEDGDYEEWFDLVSAKNPDAPILEKITVDNFSKFQELHELREELRELQEELGIEGKRKGFGKQQGGFGGRHHGGHGSQR